MRFFRRVSRNEAICVEWRSARYVNLVRTCCVMICRKVGEDLNLQWFPLIAARRTSKVGQRRTVQGSDSSTSSNHLRATMFHVKHAQRRRVKPEPAGCFALLECSPASDVRMGSPLQRRPYARCSSSAI